MEIKEIYLITAYTPTLKHQDVLRNLVIKLNENNKKICLVSHTHIPQDIVERVNYYFYDEENKLDLDSRFSWKHFNNSSKYNIESKLLIPFKSSFFPVLRLVWFGVKICKFLGYTAVHQLEYDSHIINFDELDNNTKLLSDYDCILYSNKRDSESYKIQGSYVAINPQKISDDFFIYDENLLKDQFVSYKLKVENFNFDLYYSKLNFIKKPINDLEQSLSLDLNNTDASPSLYFTLLYNPDLSPDEEWFWYAYSSYPDVNNTYRHFELMINNTVTSLQVAKWALGGISKKEPLKQVKFIYNDKVVSSFDMTDGKVVSKLQKYNVLEKKQ